MSQNGREQEHLPLYGVGPFYVYCILGLTVVALLCRRLPVFSAGVLSAPWSIGLDVLGTLLMLLGVVLWIFAVMVSKVDVSIKENKLLTTGVYAWVRNPIYAAFMVFCSGGIFILGNAYFFCLPAVYWLFLTILMKATEEKWLRHRYGKEYEEYCRKVNRCIPWFPRNFGRNDERA